MKLEIYMNLEMKKIYRNRTKDNGSTQFTPVFQYIIDNNLRNVCINIFY